jgi:hypothetical protein
MTVFSYLMEAGSTYSTVLTVLIPWRVKEMISKAPYLATLRLSEPKNLPYYLPPCYGSIVCQTEESRSIVVFQRERVVIVLCVRTEPRIFVSQKEQSCSIVVCQYDLARINGEYFVNT